MKIIEPGFSLTIQDLGRRGYQRYGVPLSGAMDRFALMAANALVGNPVAAAGFEAALAGFAILADRDCVVAGTGRGFEFWIDDMAFSLWSSALARKGQMIRICSHQESGWGYLGISGGICVPWLLGSRSTYLPGKWSGFAGSILKEQDEVPIREQPDLSALIRLAGRRMPQRLIPGYSNPATIRFIPTKGNGAIKPSLLKQFQGSRYRVETPSRMAYRLTGESLPISGATDILSEGVGAGVIQLLGSGQVLVLMRDAQTTGGYLNLGTVITADLDILAQSINEKGEIRFVSTSVDTAQDVWRKKYKELLSLTWDEGVDG